jgi:cobalt-zinc-cadmium efflux system outer membrane protein
MKLNLLFLIGFVPIAVSLNARAEAEGSACTAEFKTYREVIACAEARSPEVQISAADLNRAKAEVKAAEQWKNPELSAESVHGSTNGQANSQTDIALGVPIELGGKISARRAVAQGGVLQVEARAYETRAKVKSETLVKLHRLRQLYHEQEVIDEAIGTFTKLVNQFSKRPKLSPEQQMSNSVFRMSKSEYEIKRAETVEEMAALNAYFKVAVGRDVEQLKSLAPESVKSWPDFQNEYKPGLSPRSMVAQAELQTSQAALSLARSEAWPTLTVGPSLQIQNQAGQTAQMFGLNVSLPLPLFNTNGGGRAAAASGVSLSENRKSFAYLEEEKHREELLRVFNESKKVLLTSLSHKDIEGRHQEVESLFLKGIVPSALVIEAHRTFVELEKTRNQRELKAIESMMSIYTIDGKISELAL